MSKYRDLCRCTICMEFTDMNGNPDDIGCVNMYEITHAKKIVCVYCRGDKKRNYLSFEESVKMKPKPEKKVSKPKTKRKRKQKPKKDNKKQNNQTNNTFSLLL